MKKTRKTSAPPPAKKRPGAAVSPSDAQILALFRKAEAAWKLSRRQLDAALGEIGDAAGIARRKPATRMDKAHADRLDAQIARVRNAVENDNAADAAVLAIRLTETWLRFKPATSSRSSVRRRSR